MNKNNPRSAIATCCACLSSVFLFSGCQLQQALQRFTSSSKPEDPSYLLDPATEARQLAAMSSQTRDDLNAFTDRSAYEMAAATQAARDSSVPGTASAYLAQSATNLHNLPVASQGQGAAQQQTLTPEQSSLAAGIGAADNSYSGLSKYPVSASAQQPPATFGRPTNSPPLNSTTSAPNTPMSSVMPASGVQQATSAPAAPTAELHVRGVTPGAGPVRVALFNSASSFPNRNAAQHKFSLDSSAPQVNAPLTTASPAIAVAVFQDLNNDGKLNRSAFGIPTEPYGFSGANSRSLGPPSFAEAAVQPRGSVEVLLTK